MFKKFSTYLTMTAAAILFMLSGSIITAYAAAVVEIKKIDDQFDVPIAGVKFAVYDESGKKVKETGCTNNLGITEVTISGSGTFYIQEIETPSSYSVTSGGTEYTVYLSNPTDYCNMYPIILDSSDDEEEPLSPIITVDTRRQNYQAVVAGSEEEQEGVRILTIYDTIPVGTKFVRLDYMPDGVTCDITDPDTNGLEFKNVVLLPGETKYVKFTVKVNNELKYSNLSQKTIDNTARAADDSDDITSKTETPIERNPTGGGSSGGDGGGGGGTTSVTPAGPEVPTEPVPSTPVTAPPTVSDGHQLVSRSEREYDEIDENGTPLGTWRLNDDGIWIFEEAVPLGSMPRTGDNGVSIWLLFGLSSLGLGGALLLSYGRRKWQ